MIFGKTTYTGSIPCIDFTRSIKYDFIIACSYLKEIKSLKELINLDIKFFDTELIQNVINRNKIGFSNIDSNFSFPYEEFVILNNKYYFSIDLFLQWLEYDLNKQFGNDWKNTIFFTKNGYYIKGILDTKKLESKL